MRAQIVDKQYRLQPSDLDRARQRVRITNVTYQGLEQMKLLLHFDQFPKPLVLEHNQIQELVSEMGGTDFRKWVGRSVELYLTAGDEPFEQKIKVEVGSAHTEGISRPMESAPLQKVLTNRDPLGHQTQDQPRGNPYIASIFLITALAIIALLAYLLEQSESLQTLFGF